MAFDPNNRMQMMPAETDAPRQFEGYGSNLIAEIMRRRGMPQPGTTAPWSGGLPTRMPPRTGFDQVQGRIEKGAWNDPNMMRGRGGMGRPMAPPLGQPQYGGPGYRDPRLASERGPAMQPGMAKPAMVNVRQPMQKPNGMPMGMFKQPMKNTVGSVLGGMKPKPNAGGTQGSWF